jgi:hypothetical protein
MTSRLLPVAPVRERRSGSVGLAIENLVVEPPSFIVRLSDETIQ